MCTNNNNEQTNDPKSPTTIPPSPLTPPLPPRPANLMTNASLLSRIFFIWPYKLLSIGLQRPLSESDLPAILTPDTSHHNLHHVTNLWTTEKTRHPTSPSLHRVFVLDFLKSTWYVQPLMCLAATAKIIQAVCLGNLIQSISSPQSSSHSGYLWSSLLVLAGLVILFEHHHVFFVTWRKGMQYRISCVAALYSKSLRLSSTSGNDDTGQLMNLASNDVERFLLAALFGSHLFWAPVECIAILVVGWRVMGVAFAAGVALLLGGFVPFQSYVSRMFAVYRGRVAVATDERVQLTSQAVKGARVMKMSGMEYQFLESIGKLRAREVERMRGANRLKACNEASYYACNVVVSLVVFLVHVLVCGGTLTAKNVFTVLTLNNVMQLEMTKHFSLGIMGVSEAYVSIRRIQNYLELPELPMLSNNNTSIDKKSPSTAVENNDNTDETTNNDDDDDDTTPIMSLSNVTCYWNHQPPPPLPPTKETTTSSSSSSDIESSPGLRPALSNISLDFYKGTLTCLIGPVGSGKSALLQAIVGELPPQSGVVRQKDGLVVAYAAQDPWIMDGTILENILMGQPYNHTLYTQILSATALATDLELLPLGSHTIVGDRGVQLSGGQRARLNLARALYRDDADILVLDDPLSAVDAAVGRILMEKGVWECGVGRGRCVVLATHQCQYVREQKEEGRCVLVMEGKVECIGGYEECVEKSGGLLTAHEMVEKRNEEEEGEVLEMMRDDAPLVESLTTLTNEKHPTPTSTKEESVTGHVRLSTYLNYIAAMGGYPILTLLTLLFCLTQSSTLVTIAYMGRWAELPPSDQTDPSILILVICLSGSVTILSIVRADTYFRLALRASRKLHDDMARSVVRTSMEFFDTYPMGRILNRFSADVGSNDDSLPLTLFDFSVIFFIVVGTIVTTAVVLPFALVVMVPLGLYFVRVRRVFVTSTRELKRLEGLARSPIFSMMGESLGGVATIRANDCMGYFLKLFQQKHDAHTRAFFSFIACSRWVGFRMDSIMFMLMSLVSFSSVLVIDKGWLKVDPSILGLALSMLLQLAGMFQWCIRQSAEVVNQMVSVERVLAFGKLPPEAPLTCDGDEEIIARSWPTKGAITATDLSVRYRSSLPLALRNATFSIPAGSRVGIVGRTGSGKSTIVQTIFRLLEAEHGSIQIDDVDISTIGLHLLRTKISVIPQTPTLFGGTSIRDNLDLFNQRTDEEIQQTLDDCRLSDLVNDLPLGMHSEVSENGANFSVGQRQLLCLARALLSRNKILILDEATASVDRRTDKLLHDTLHRNFSDATILAVAHRLDTVIEHDYVLVLGEGRVLEFGTPAELLSREKEGMESGGVFRRMVEDTGEVMANDLRRRAFAKEKRCCQLEKFDLD